MQNADYHKTINRDVFKKWVEEQLISALNKINQKCVVPIMDNAPYHSVRLEKNPNPSYNNNFKPK